MGYNGGMTLTLEKKIEIVNTINTAVAKGYTVKVNVNRKNERHNARKQH